MNEPYEILGVEPTASLSDIRRAFIGAAKRYHPDRFTDAKPAERAKAEKKMRELNGAFAEIVSRRRGGPDPQEILAGEQWLADWWEAQNVRKRDDDRRRARFRRWDEIESERRAREAAEADSIAAVWRATYGDPAPAASKAQPAAMLAGTTEGPRPSSFATRLRDAKHGKAADEKARSSSKRNDR